MKLRILFFALLILISSNLVAAKFLCGEVVPTDEMTPSWYDVKVYLTSNENYFSTCKVSPDNFRYCCDLDLIYDNYKYRWKMGDVFSTKITDVSSGYFALPKNITLTGEGYDIAPILNLEKAIKIIQPKNKLIISENLTKLEVLPSSGCSEFGKIDNLTKTILCGNCNESLDNFQVNFGRNDFSFYAICNSEEYNLDSTFFIVEDIFFKKDLDSKIKNQKIKTVSIQGELSSNVSNLEFKEYVPIEFEISSVSSFGKIEPSTSTHNMIIWNFSGKTFNFEYSILPSITGDFSFISELENNLLGKKSVKVCNFVPPISSGGGNGNGGYSSWGHSHKYTPKNFSKVTEIFPLIKEDEDITVAFYSKVFKERASFDLFKFIYEGTFDRTLDYIKSYAIETNMNSSEKGKMKFEYEINETELEGNNHKDIEVYGRKNGRFFSITGGVISSENGMIKYGFESPEALTEFFIFAKKSKLNIREKLQITIDKIWFYILDMRNSKIL